MPARLGKNTADKATKEILLWQFSDGEILSGVGEGAEEVHPRLDRALILACFKGRTAVRRHGRE